LSAEKAVTKREAPKSPTDELAEYHRKRDFSKTAEPKGMHASPRRGKLRFVIQKHAASQLHFDLRLELDGVMKSWAIPKGPSADPSIKRLAVQVEDHPIDYNTFEGTIPKGEYGGGTVMLWDKGTYTADLAAESDDVSAVRNGYDAGDLKITFHGKRMRGSYALVRTKGMRGGASSKPSWLLIKHRDPDARPESKYDIVQANMTSIVSGRTMEEIRTAS
jgi:bifunctional non-homologous end joining protein LigD